MTQPFEVTWSSLVLALCCALGAGTAQAADVRELASVKSRSAESDLFAIAGDQTIRHYWRADSAERWTAFEQLDGLGQDIAAVDIGAGLLEVFVVGLDNDVWSNRQLGPLQWSGFQPLHRASKRVAAAKTKAGRVELFVIGEDDAVWRSTRLGPDGRWTAWRSLGGHASQLSAAQASDGSVLVFSIGADNAVWFTGSERADWRSLGGVASDVAVGRGQGGVLSVFAVGVRDEVWQKRATSAAKGGKPAFGPWESLRGTATRVSASAQGLIALDSSARLLLRSPEQWRALSDAAPLEATFYGRATMEIPELHVKQVKRLRLGVRFSADRHTVQVTSFPPLTTRAFGTPLGESRSTITLTAGGTGSYDPATGRIELPLTLHFDQSLDVPIVTEDADVALSLSSDAEGGLPLQAASGQLALRGTSKFTGTGTVNPLRDKPCQLSIVGTFGVSASALAVPTRQ